MTPVPEALAVALADRYRFERAIGQGGMATVYLATDVKHGRSVAVKVLRPDLAASIGAERFLREIQLAARLQHPHILLLIDSGEAAGFLYYVMPFVDGESLRGRLDREGTLPAPEVLDLAGQVADALDYAHRRGVVHRDIKPENILLSDGHAIVADFGIAKALTAASDKSLTRTGFPVGTVGYMSPEQAAGFAELNERSDVFSLGCVVYEMVVGKVPGMWPSEESGRVLRFLEAPPEHRAALDGLPGTVEQVLVRALMLRAEHRFPGPRAMVDALAAGFGEKPRYSAAQVRGIVARAAEIESATPTQTGGLSLGGVQQLAADVGIAPQHVQRAVREIGRPTLAPKSGPFLGSPNRIIVDRVIEGEVDSELYPSLVDEVRVTIGNVGQTSTLGRSLAWRTVTPSGQGRAVSLSLTPTNGQTRLRLEENLSPIAGGLFGGLMGGLGGTSVPFSIILGVEILHLPLLIPAFLVAGVGGAWQLARKFFRAAHDKRRAELEELADRLATFATENLSASTRPRLRR